VEYSAHAVQVNTNARTFPFADFSATGVQHTLDVGPGNRCRYRVLKDHRERGPLFRIHGVVISYNDIFVDIVAYPDDAGFSAMRETGDWFAIRGVTCAVAEIEFRKAAL
jgi:hypothetical protein